MSIKVALHHSTHYNYDRTVSLGPQVIRLRPAPHCRTRINSYSLKISPSDHFINWQQDPHGNFLARVVFNEPTDHFHVDVDVVADMSVINPFDFFIEDFAETHPFKYGDSDLEELRPYLEKQPAGPLLNAFIESVDHDHERTIDFLVNLNSRLNSEIKYTVRLEPGVQTCEETLLKRSGSCRDTSWLLVQILRHLGLAARFVSGYLIQLIPDIKAIDGPVGSESDFTDLHAWAEVYLPGAGWIGLDPTSGLLTGEGHLPLAATPLFTSAAPISGGIEPCETTFEFDMSVERIDEAPRVTKPYSDKQWEKIDALGNQVEDLLQDLDVRLTMGGEPTFLSIDNPGDPQWRTEALGEQKEELSNELLVRFQNRFTKNSMLHHGQGKWYPGEPLPRWSKTIYWRTDGEPLWTRPNLLARTGDNHDYNADDAKRFISAIAGRLGVETSNVLPAYEDVLYHLWQEQRIPGDVDLQNLKAQNSRDRKRLARVLEKGLGESVGSILPLQFQWWLPEPRWVSGPWRTRADHIYLIPGDSPMGYRLPIKALEMGEKSESPFEEFYPLDPLAERPELASPELIRERRAMHQDRNESDTTPLVRVPDRELTAAAALETATVGMPARQALPTEEKLWREFPGDRLPEFKPDADDRHAATDSSPPSNRQTFGPVGEGPVNEPSGDGTIPFALSVEPRNGLLHVFMPPIDRLDYYIELLSAIEDTAAELHMPVIIEGYKPPSDHRMQSMSITPDPGVIEVNVQPASNWSELKSITEGIYDDARHTRLATETFELDGTHTGTGGGNHIVIGGSKPADSPWFRRPDLLRSFITFWQNHPSLSYLFSGRFVGPTSQAPRIDDARDDNLYEMQIAFDELAAIPDCPPHIVDSLFRNLLTDLTGNTHRSEICIDKLCSPAGPTGRLGLVEFRAFEMPPHARMSLTQQLLLRCLIVQFWQQPYTEPLVRWKTRLHDQFMLPHFVLRDFTDVIESLRLGGFEMDVEWFRAHFEFRFPSIGKFTHNAMQVQLRQAIEPWNTLGEESSSQGTARYVDSSVERIEVKMDGFVDERYIVTCNGRAVPMYPTEVEGQYVAGIRYRAWQPTSCLHPTIPVDAPLTVSLYDSWLKRTVDGCRYHVGHPGGLNPETFPVNSYEAEGRRASRFVRTAHGGMHEIETSRKHES